MCVYVPVEGRNSHSKARAALLLDFLALCSSHAAAAALTSKVLLSDCDVLGVFGAHEGGVSVLQGRTALAFGGDDVVRYDVNKLGGLHLLSALEGTAL